MYTLGHNKLLIVLLSVFVATGVLAAPTTNDCNKKFFDTDVSLTSYTHIPFITETSQFSGPSNSHFAAIGAEIIKPPADFTDSQPVSAKTLPPVPGALFMVLTGFLCISLVKDRRVWLTALAGLLWVGQAGVQVIPQLALNISQKYIQRQSTTNIISKNWFVYYDRIRSDIEGTQYIGLLRHLAGIPESTRSLPLSLSLASLQAQRSNLSILLKNIYSARTKSNIAAPQCIIIDFSSLLNLSVICPVARTEQDIHFSSEFIFQQLPRGPPKLDLWNGFNLPMWRADARRPFKMEVDVIFV